MLDVVDQLVYSSVYTKSTAGDANVINVTEVSPEIEAAQAEYAARPFAVRWVDSHFAATSRFKTFEDAFQYLQQVWECTQKRVKQYPYHASNLRQSYVETPAGRMPARYYLLADDVSSYC